MKLSNKRSKKYMVGSGNGNITTQLTIASTKDNRIILPVGKLSTERLQLKSNKRVKELDNLEASERLKRLEKLAKLQTFEKFINLTGRRNLLNRERKTNRSSRKERYNRRSTNNYNYNRSRPYEKNPPRVKITSKTEKEILADRKLKAESSNLEPQILNEESF